MKDIRRLFGTDGIRGLANRELTAELALKVGRACAKFLTGRGSRGKIIIGRDPRPSGDLLKDSLSAGILSSGHDVIDAGIITTPAVALIASIMKLDGGVVISASHNPFEDNGIKLFGKNGQKLSDIQEKEIEDYIADGPDNNSLPLGNDVGRHEYLKDAPEVYLDRICGKYDMDLKGLKIVLDCANGASSVLAGRALERFGPDVITYNTGLTGENINDNCGSTHPEQLKKLVAAEGADIGFAYDGDGDRVVACDSKGNVLDGDSMIAFCALYMVKNNKLKNHKLVTTIMANMGFEKLMNENGIEVEKTPVGDRYVLERMLETNSALGGEQSGHIIFKDISPTGDGIISTLEFLDAIVKSGYDINKIYDLVPRFPQHLESIRVADKDKVMEFEEVRAKVMEMEGFLGGKGRIVLRPSGTEPLIRIMVEAEEQDLVNQVIGELSRVIEEKCGK